METGIIFFLCFLFLLASFPPASEETKLKIFVKINIKFAQNGKRKIFCHSMTMGVGILFRRPIKLANYISTNNKLIKSCDIEINPGPYHTFKFVSNIFNKRSKNLKFFFINGQSITKNKHQIEHMLHDLGENTIFGICETWLCETDGERFWQFDRKKFKTFRVDRKDETKKYGGGVMLLVPTSLCSLKLEKILIT